MSVKFELLLIFFTFGAQKKTNLWAYLEHT